MKTIQRSLVSLSVLFACNSLAAGFQVAEHSASGLGRAFSGEGAVADNASVLARNPAAMTLFDTAQFSGAVSIVDPEVNIYDVDNKEHSKDVAPLQVVPAAYYISPINDKWAWGIGMFTNYGVATDYPDDISAGDMAGDTSLLSVNLNPNIAYRVNESFSVGAGLNLVYAEAELTRHKGELAGLVGGNPSDKLIGMTGETFAYGWNVGAMYELNENNRFSIGYRSSVDLDFDDGEFTSYDSGRATSPKVDGRLQIELPSILELSAFHQLNEQWAIHYGWQQTDWSTFKELKATSPDCTDNGVAGQCFYKPEKYEDNNRYSLGATYQLNSKWTLRAGYAYDEQAGEATLSIPDSDRMWYSAGFTYAWSENMTVDAGFALVVSDEGEFTETNGAQQERTFEAEGTAYLSSVQLNYTFN
ncbi:porin [Vibrio lentus]|uniref:porin n=1 Tax=Vibrio lentus TaxID=136468 RepID=UPI000C84F5C4|nr:porin [Vibrio lentus]PMG25629.1 long-chain fatty acid transporter [Vibrio lentus]PMH15590.1 long-chain fatty acid transporter [Vibrio lentus]PMJ06837.1 long-chain fatty acid transporter [Vibrio lentus]PMK87680.1 long-chain fatty acid transporter [Vibrio lentus]PMN14713.1 long-chain fatty acid transporter [Vibrio lentus]